MTRNKTKMKSQLISIIPKIVDKILQSQIWFLGLHWGFQQYRMTVVCQRHQEMVAFKEMKMKWKVGLVQAQSWIYQELIQLIPSYLLITIYHQNIILSKNHQTHSHLINQRHQKKWKIRQWQVQHQNLSLSWPRNWAAKGIITASMTPWM